MSYVIRTVTGGAGIVTEYDERNAVCASSADEAIAEACGMAGTKDIFESSPGARRIARVHPDGGVDHL